MHLSGQPADPQTAVLEDFDVSDPRLYEQDVWQPYFARLRAEDPVHFQAESPFGPFWSRTRFKDIIEVDTNFIDRENPRHHISFGFGVHRCMGNRLAEMQLHILWEEIMQRFSKVEVVGEPERVLSNFVRGYSHLAVRLHPL